MQRIVSLLDTGRHSLPNKSPTSVSIQTPSIHQTSYTSKNMFPMDLWIMQKNCGYLANSQLYLSSRRLRSIGNWYMVQWSNGPQWSSCTAMQRFCPSCHAMVNWSKLEVKSNLLLILYIYYWSVVVVAARTAGGCYVHFNIFYDHINIKFVVIKLQNIWFHGCN